MNEPESHPVTICLRDAAPGATVTGFKAPKRKRANAAPPKTPSATAYSPSASPTTNRGELRTRPPPVRRKIPSQPLCSSQRLRKRPLDAALPADLTQTHAAIPNGKAYSSFGSSDGLSIYSGGTSSAGISLTLIPPSSAGGTFSIASTSAASNAWPSSTSSRTLSESAPGKSGSPCKSPDCTFAGAIATDLVAGLSGFSFFRAMPPAEHAAGQCDYLDGRTPDV
jgi:hypothetical protein